MFIISKISNMLSLICGVDVMSKLKGKFVLITGASSGIGKSLSFQVAAHQAIPILIARSEEKLVSISKKIEQEYQIKALYYAVDITDQERWGAILQEIQLAVHPIDVLINNAGIGYFESFEKMEWDYVNSMLRLNLESLYFTTYKLLPNMKLHSPAHIVNIGSQAGKIATPKSAVYSATKAGVINFSNALRMELEPEVFVTSVNIGPVRTAFLIKQIPAAVIKKVSQNIC